MSVSWGNGGRFFACPDLVSEIVDDEDGIPTCLSFVETGARSAQIVWCPSVASSVHVFFLLTVSAVVYRPEPVMPLIF